MLQRKRNTGRHYQYQLQSIDGAPMYEGRIFRIDWVEPNTPPEVVIVYKVINGINTVDRVFRKFHQNLNGTDIMVYREATVLHLDE